MLVLVLAHVGRCSKRLLLGSGCGRLLPVNIDLARIDAKAADQRGKIERLRAKQTGGWARESSWGWESPYLTPSALDAVQIAFTRGEAPRISADRAKQLHVQFPRQFGKLEGIVYLKS